MATFVKLGLTDSAFAWVKAFQLPIERFAAFRECTAGMRYIREKSRYLAPIDKIPQMLIRLRSAGFNTNVEGELVRTLQRFTAQQWADLKAAQERIERLDAEFHARTGNNLYDFQRNGAQWLATRRGALLADEMGLGKTLQTIAAIRASSPVIVCAPAVAKGVWLRELRKWRPHLRVSVLKGRTSFRWPKDGEVLITNFDILPDVHKPLSKGGCDDGWLPKVKCQGCATNVTVTGYTVKNTGQHKTGCDGFLPRIRCLGCADFLKEVPKQCTFTIDEAHNTKNTTALRKLRATAISEVVRNADGWAWALTATPLINEPKELWSVYSTVGIAQEAFGDWKEFVHLFRGQPLHYGGYEWGTPHAEVVERIRRVSLRRMRHEVLPDLPTKRWSEVVVDITDKKARKKCDEYIKSLGGQKTFEELVESGKLEFETMSSVRAALASAKIPAMLAMVKEFEEQKEPLVVFSAHRAPIDIFENRKGWRVITGDTPADERTEIEELFQAGKLRGVACTIKAGGVAITLTKAAIALFVDLAWSPADNAQAEDRICRIGQDRGCVIYILVSDHMLDARVTELLVKKRVLIEHSVDAASVVEDKNLANEFEAQIKRIQVEVASGRAVRRMAESDEEKSVLIALHTLLFGGESDQRLAASLAEEADMIGLSDSQWKLALDVAARGVEPGVSSSNEQRKAKQKAVKRAE